MNRGKYTSPSAQTPDELLSQYCKAIPEWPHSWAIANQDTVLGHSIVQEIVPFLIDRIKQGRAKNTIKIYAGYLWALGGELIRHINEDEAERKLSAKQLILKHVSNDGGPFWRHARDDLDHQRYDAVCRGLYKFMTR
jgi:hypothetical protein